VEALLVVFVEALLTLFVKAPWVMGVEALEIAGVRKRLYGLLVSGALQVMGVKGSADCGCEGERASWTAKVCKRTGRLLTSSIICRGCYLPAGVERQAVHRGRSGNRRCCGEQEVRRRLPVFVSRQPGEWGRCGDG
jgi:hypothetical protein